MPITSAISEKNQAKVSRVSLKNRNPENVPNEWQQVVLQDFEKRAVAGEPVDAMASTEFIESDGKTQMRFMKALPASGACLTCHGQEITDELQAKLSEFYPDDNATGYSLGDIRGAIVVTKDYQH